MSKKGLCPQALKRNSTLKTLKLRSDDSYDKLKILPSDVIEICKEKNPGYKLTIEGNNPFSVDEYVEIVKQFPNSIIQMDVNTEDCDFGSVIHRVFNS